MEEWDVIVVGAGAAGYAAAIYACRYGLKTLVVSRDFGGTTNNAVEVGNYPGFVKIDGPELMKKFEHHARTVGARMEFDEIIEINKTEQGFELKGFSKVYKSKSVILTIGKKVRKLGVPGEDKLSGKGVSYCATCDAPFFKDKTVAVVGGGDAAVEGAAILAQHASKVYIIHRRDKFRAEPYWVEKVNSMDNVEFVMNSTVQEILGEQKVMGVKLNDGRVIKLDGVFIEIGSIPPKEFLEKIGLELDERGFVNVRKDMSTNIKGIYAAGDVTNGSNHFEQIITAAAEGAIAANSVFKYLQGE